MSLGKTILLIAILGIACPAISATNFSPRKIFRAVFSRDINERELTLDESIRAYQDINNYLMISVRGNDWRPNMEMASQLLDKEISYKKKSFSKRKSLAVQPFSSNKNPEVLIKSLIQFLSLQRVNSEPPDQCAASMTHLLIKNDASAHNAINRKLLAIDESNSRESQEASSSLNRIDEIVFEAARRRAEICYPLYEQEWVILMSSVQSERQKVAEFFQRLLEQRLGLDKDDKSVEDIVEMLQEDRLGPIFASGDLNVVFKYLSQMDATSSEPSSDPVDINYFDGRYWMILFTEHLIEPCDEFVRTLSDVFESFEFDMQLRHHIPENQFSVMFNEDFLNFKMCKKLQKEQGDFILHVTST